MPLKIGTCLAGNKSRRTRRDGDAAGGSRGAGAGFALGTIAGAAVLRNPAGGVWRSTSSFRGDRAAMMHTDGTRFVFVTGGTGYIGTRAIAALLQRGHRVRALARPASRHKLPDGCEVALGDALDGATFAARVAPADTFLQLVGTPHPGPAKAAEFERVDFASLRESMRVAREAGVAHFIYLSVAHPVNVMRAYQDVRIRGEELIRRSGLHATLLRPWYVLGPGHWWPIVLLPFYAAAAIVPPLREAARRAGLVTIRQMVRSIVAAVEAGPPAADARAIDVPAIRRSSLSARTPSQR
jgi:uncharacterized protein YbjT (DUF2867 family)